MQQTPFDPNARSARWSAIALGVIGVEVFIVQPGFVQGIVQALNFSEREAGIVASAEMMGVALTAVAMSFLAARLNWRKVLIAASALATAANVASGFVDTAFAFAVMRCLAGLGLGALISLSWAAVGLTRNPDRQFSLYLTWVLIYGAVGLLTMPMIFAAVGLQGFLLIMAVLASMIQAIEQHVDWLADCLGHMRDIGADSIEPLQADEDAWVAPTASVVGEVSLGAGASVWYGAVLRGAGGNPRAIERAGWSLLKAKMTMYAFAGIFGMLAGLALIGLTTSADANIAARYTLLSIAGVILGGGEFVGGRVSPTGAVIGAITLTLAGSFLTFLQIPPDWQIGATGVILIIVLALRALINRAEER